MKKPLRIAIIGCGNIFTMHATSILNTDGLVLAAVCDIKPERLEYVRANFGDFPSYTDYRVMLDTVKPDAVHICTPHHLHIEMARYALECGAHVLSEKPMSIRYADAEACVKLAAGRQLMYGVIFQCRYNNSSVTVKKYLDNSTLGKVISARTVLTWNKPDSYYALSDWKGTYAYEGGGVVIDQAIHSLDLANWFIGSEPVRIQASLANRNHRIMEVEDSAEGLIHYQNGATLGFWAMNNYGCDEPIEIRLLCERGTVRMSYDDAVITLNNGGVITVNADRDNIDYRGGKDYWGFRHISQIRQFYRAVQGLEPLQISGAEALKTQRLIEGIYYGLNK